jgi:hypothetical protein
MTAALDRIKGRVPDALPLELILRLSRALRVLHPNRRRYHPHVPVWEIHPIMRLRVLREDDE